MYILYANPNPILLHIIIWYYLRSMEALPDDMLVEFMKGKHVMRHTPGLWNGIWSDMFIESTLMRYGHEAGGLVGLTLQPSAFP